MGTSGKQVKEFKDMVKAFHKEGIAVIMDVVYNHLSEYEIGNLKQIDKEYYFRLNPDGSFIAESYNVIALIDSDPKSSYIRNRFIKKYLVCTYFSNNLSY